MFGTFKPGISSIRRSAVIRHLLCWESWITVCTKTKLACRMLLRKHRESTVSNIWLVFVYPPLFQLRGSDNTFLCLYRWLLLVLCLSNYVFILYYCNVRPLCLPVAGILCVWFCYLPLIASSPGYLNLIICWIILSLSRRNVHFRPWCGCFHCEHHSARPWSSYYLLDATKCTHDETLRHVRIF